MQYHNTTHECLTLLASISVTTTDCSPPNAIDYIATNLWAKNHIAFFTAFLSTHPTI